MLPEGLSLDFLLGANEIYALFTKGASALTVHWRGQLLNELERDYLPILINHKDFPQVKKILEEYNRNIEMNIYENKPVDLD
ncbi:hypothetical protein CL618_00360 [archaeon]|nr:hypothetical protein [archaeon]|tara:strand:+ start:126 stop:371 length:246 start_codon:yes stop_codon:yes gene_type:complete